jgi:hypothetical protein
MESVDHSRIIAVDDGSRTVRFVPSRHGKITGTRFAAVLGLDPFKTEFETACILSKIYSEQETTKYTEAGKVIESAIRSYVRDNAAELFGRSIGVRLPDRIRIEEPVCKEDCGYDNFRNNPVFGGMVDGYVRVDGHRRAVLEIKTARDRERWLDGSGEVNVVPETYIMQASLYAELSDLDTVVFAVGFLRDEDYARPESWVPGPNDLSIIVMPKEDIAEKMAAAEAWYGKYVLGGVTPEWTERDAKVVHALTTIRLYFLPDDLAKMVREYIRIRGDVAKEAPLREGICNGLAALSREGARAVEYEQGKLLFSVTLVGTDDGLPKMEVIEERLLE